MPKASPSWLSDPLDIFRVIDSIKELEDSTATVVTLTIRGKAYKIQRNGNSAFRPSEPAYRIDPVEGFTPSGRFSVTQLTEMLEAMG